MGAAERILKSSRIPRNSTQRRKLKFGNPFSTPAGEHQSTKEDAVFIWGRSGRASPHIYPAPTAVVAECTGGTDDGQWETGCTGPKYGRVKTVDASVVGWQSGWQYIGTDWNGFLRCTVITTFWGGTECWSYLSLHSGCASRTPSWYMFCFSRSTPDGKSLGRTVGDGKAFGQFTDNVKLINEL